MTARKIRNSMICSSALCIIVGLIMLVFPRMTAVTLCVVFGAVLAVMGAVRIVGYLARVDMGYMFRFDLMLGAIQLIVGVLLIAHPGAILAALPVIMGAALMVSGVLKAQLALDARRLGYRRWYLTMLAAVAGIALSVLVICNPFEGAQAIIMVMGISLIVDGALDMYTVLRVSGAVSRLEKQLRGER